METHNSVLAYLGNTEFDDSVSWQNIHKFSLHNTELQNCHLTCHFMFQVDYKAVFETENDGSEWFLFKERTSDAPPRGGGGVGGAHITKLESRNKRLGFCRKPECWQRWWLANLKWKIVPKLGSSTEVWAVSLRVIGTWDCQLQRSAGGTKTTWWLIFYDDVCHVEDP